MLSASIPSRSASWTAARMTRSRLSGFRRGSAATSIRVDILTLYVLTYTLSLHRTYPRGGPTHVRALPRIRPGSREGAPGVTAATVVHPRRVGRPSRSVQNHRWPLRSPASDGHHLGHDAAEDRRSKERPTTGRDPRLLRGWAEHRHHGDERLGRGGAGVVAEPSGKRRCRDRAARWPTQGPGSCRYRG